MADEVKKRGRPPSGLARKEFTGIRLRHELREAQTSFSNIVEEGTAIMLTRPQEEHNRATAPP
jgi:hypothetical protein